MIALIYVKISDINADLLLNWEPMRYAENTLQPHRVRAELDLYAALWIYKYMMRSR